MEVLLLRRQVFWLVQGWAAFPRQSRPSCCCWQTQWQLYSREILNAEAVLYVSHAYDLLFPFWSDESAWINAFPSAPPLTSTCWLSLSQVEGHSSRLNTAERWIWVYRSPEEKFQERSSFWEAIEDVDY